MLKKVLKIRFQKDKKRVVVSIIPPDYQSEQEMRVAYAKAYRQAIQQGVATRPSMLELMRQEGIWGASQEEELTELTIHAALIEGVLIEKTDFDEQRKLVIDLTKVRSKIYELVNIKTLPLEHTAEQIAEDVKLDFYLSICTVDENGLKYFRSHKDFLDRRHDADVEKIYKELVEELSKDNIEMLRQLPEHKWLINNELMDKQGNMLNKEIEEEIVENLDENPDVAEALTKE